jgi:hypothetical protein
MAPGDTRSAEIAGQSEKEMWCSVRWLIRMFLQWQADAIADQKACRHDGAAPYCAQCASLRFPIQ